MERGAASGDVRGGSAPLRRRDLLAGLPFAGSARPVRAALPGLKAARPRLLTSPHEIAGLAARLDGDPVGRAARDGVLREAARLLDLPPVQMAFEARRPVLLPTSREVLRRVEHLGAAWMLTRDRRYAARVAAEARQAAGFPDWNPSHFLDTAEMTAAAALALDWCHDALTDTDRTVITDAIVAKGLTPGLTQHRRGAFWTRATHNWNLVCNGGMILGALSVGEAAPALAAEMVERGIASARPAFASYSPDGGWDEGPSYWDYATQYAVFLVAALDSALGHDAGLSATPGFASAGLFRLHMEGPSGRVFNFADGGGDGAPNPGPDVARAPIRAAAACLAGHARRPVGRHGAGLVPARWTVTGGGGHPARCHVPARRGRQPARRVG